MNLRQFEHWHEALLPGGHDNGVRNSTLNVVEVHKHEAVIESGLSAVPGVSLSNSNNKDDQRTLSIISRSSNHFAHKRFGTVSRFTSRILKADIGEELVRMRNAIRRVCQDESMPGPTTKS